MQILLVFCLLLPSFLANPLPEQREFHVLPIQFAKAAPKDDIVAPLSPMSDLFKTYMLAPVTVGTPRKGEKPQSMRKAIFTLGSGDLWVQDTMARKAMHCPYNVPVDTFYPGNSTSYRPSGQRFSTQSYKGQIEGVVGVDNILIAPGLVAQNATFGQAHKYPCFFIENSISGILGLAWPQLGDQNLAKASPVFSALSTLPKPLFSLFINSSSQGGSITFGQLNKEQCAGDWQFSPVTKTGHWQFELSSFSIGSNQHKLPQQAVLLESTQMILGQIEQIDRFTTELGPSAGYSELSMSVVVSCKDFHEGKLPNVAFQLGTGAELTLTPQDYITVDNSDGEYCETAFGYKKDYFNTDSMPGDFSGVNWVFGRTLMGRYCTAYDFGQKRVGFSLTKKH